MLRKVPPPKRKRMLLQVARIQVRDKGAAGAERPPSQGQRALAGLGHVRSSGRVGVTLRRTGGDAQFRQGLARALLGARLLRRSLLRSGACGHRHVILPLPGQDGGKEDDDEDKGQACQPDPNTLHAALYAPAWFIGATLKRKVRLCRTAMAQHDAGTLTIYLDEARSARKGPPMRKTLLIAACGAAIATLAACSEPEVVTVNKFDPQAEALKNRPAVELPPTIVNTRTYRCRDNSLVYIEFLSNNTANYRTQRGTTPTVLTAEGGDPPYVAEGYSVSANADEITLTAPGKGTQSCRSSSA